MGNQCQVWFSLENVGIRAKHLIMYWLHDGFMVCSQRAHQEKCISSECDILPWTRQHLAWEPRWLHMTVWWLRPRWLCSGRDRGWSQGALWKKWVTKHSCVTGHQQYALPQSGSSIGFSLQADDEPWYGRSVIMQLWEKRPFIKMNLLTRMTVNSSTNLFPCRVSTLLTWLYNRASASALRNHEINEQKLIHFLKF